MGSQLEGGVDYMNINFSVNCKNGKPVGVCVMCGKSTNGYYESSPKIPLCFEHYEDGSFANYLTNQKAKLDDGKLAKITRTDYESHT